ncbi:MAG: hypothetical protein ACPLXC_00130 [Candidatus Pacearchaeota archaeon]
MINMRLSTIVLFLSFILLLLAVVGASGCAPQAECLTDNDCVKVQITCCPCNSGGTEQCVPRGLASVYEDKLKDCPPQNQLICTALYNCKISNCTCIKGKCGPE